MLNTILVNIAAAITNGSTPYIECRIWSHAYKAWMPPDLVACNLDVEERVSKYFRRKGRRDQVFTVTVGIGKNKVVVYTHNHTI